MRGGFFFRPPGVAIRVQAQRHKLTDRLEAIRFGVRLQRNESIDFFQRAGVNVEGQLDGVFNGRKRRRWLLASRLH
ncbi:MAG: hypothetical protein J0H41_05775 [Rhizobiales bacterium]|nr:hypothetical protein [Hyphomicrobiales bacterium]